MEEEELPADQIERNFGLLRKTELVSTVSIQI
jgi:hypothetical protein